MNYWRDVYGFDMGHLRRLVLSEAQVDDVPVTALATPPTSLHSLDLLTVKDEDLDFTARFTLTPNEGVEAGSPLHGVSISFDTEFTGRTLEGGQLEGWEPVRLSTLPEDESTHWRQTVLWLDEPLPWPREARVDGSIEFKRDTSHRRQYIFRLRMQGGEEMREQVFRVG